MARLLYGMITSLDGFAVADEGDLGRGAEDEEVHTYVGDLFRDVGTYLYGRRMYETMVFWETVHLQADVPQHILDYGRDWRAAEKVVYSTTLQEVSSERTRVERRFDPDAVRALKAASAVDLTIDGPTLAAQAIDAGLVDEIHVFMTSTAVGGGTPLLPRGRRLDLRLLEHRAFDSGLVHLRYATR
ncbi:MULTISPECIES: dihydrofolate reductase family protein [unclassified Agrococcus]|uniref:dihydrofolate reductase family protein n=1 Tax=unclassified Agrococcus TaxID=2615065 RepID=UPI003623EA25